MDSPQVPPLSSDLETITEESLESLFVGEDLNPEVLQEANAYVQLYDIPGIPVEGQASADEDVQDHWQ